MEQSTSWQLAARQIANECLAGRVRKLSRVITGLYDEALRKHEIGAGQLTILSLVAALEQVTPAQLSSYLSLERSTVSRNVARMVEQGWLATVPGHDARSHEIIATPAGRRLLAAAAPDWRAAQREAEALLGTAGFRAVQQLANDLPVIPPP